MDIRNIAIIAHVDHGKTTLTDALMRQTGMTEEGVSMDSNALEQERGITIYSKNAALFYKDTKVNIVDTPGHADFGSEVERVLRSIDSVLLVVDAQEGPMPQTRFVLKKSLELGLKPIVVINKIDKPAARIPWVEEQLFELFLDLGANDEQLEFTTVYAIAKQGIAKRSLDDNSTDLSPLLDTILEHVPVASKTASNETFRAQPFNLAYDNFLGRLAVARVYDGSVSVGDSVFARKPSGEIVSGRVTKMFTFRGVMREETTTVGAGDIALIAGIPDVYIGDTLSINKGVEPLPTIAIDEPTITLQFLVNDSPFGGREGKFVTREQLRARLLRELEVNVGLKISFDSNEHFLVSGRGELHVAVLLETMRREGYEVQVSQPQAIVKDMDGVKSEPFEEVIADVPSEFSGVVIEKMGKRKGIMTSMEQGDGNVSRLIFEAPTRGILGYRSEFIIDTKGEGILSNRFLEFRPHAGEIAKRDVGSMISMATGKALGYALWNLQDRGTLYIGPSTDVYEGQVIGNVAKGNDMSVNPIKGKQLTNMRASGSDDAIQLTPPWTLSIERGLEVMAEDEYLEITPENVRLRKQYLTENDRTKAGRKK